MTAETSRLRKAAHARLSVRPSPRFAIVGVGASAGGLEAFTQLLKKLPADTGFGFVLVQHLDPQHESALAQLLARATAMPVHEATHNRRVEANHVYIIPPNATLGIANGVLKLQPRAKNQPAPRSIDFFFEALAKDQRERAIGVILSGNATDGTLGLETIKAEGGLTFAQDASARYDSMPRSAAAAGCVDFVLPPASIAKELARIARHPYVAGHAPELPPPASKSKTGTPPPSVETPLPARGRSRVSLLPASATAAAGHDDQSGYQKILELLRQHRGVDFSLYKSATILRRITRRTVLNRRDTLDTYADFLRGNTKELDALYTDTLINVTSFFRNADAFDVLKRKVFPRLLRQNQAEPLRVWVLGCSTGQEAYSIAMAFSEAAGKISRPRKLQIFATDLNEANLDKARHGLYEKTVVQDVSPDRLRRFFTEEENGYRVIKPLRQLVVFARQNVINDPPFSRMDLISCRNLMIYLEPGLQRKVLPTFHYALKPDGFLFLGASESIGTFTSLFEPVDKKQKIFSKKAAPTVTFHLPLKKERTAPPLPGRPARIASLLAQIPEGAPGSFRAELNAEREADRVTVNQFAPPGVLVNAELQILQFRGATGAYLAPPAGKASFDLLKMVREDLRLPLRAAINRARKENKTARQENVPVHHEGRIRAVNVEVVPLKNLKERCFLVFFETAAPATTPGLPVATTPTSPASQNETANRIAELEHALAETRDYLQSLQEHQESAHEELQASNEEGQSANEELQSLNEELETSKEELESTNEELITVNEEMAVRNTELNRLNGDLTNFQASTKLVIVLLDRALAIRRFSAQAEKQFDLHPGDIGRAIGSIRHHLVLPDLGAMITRVIAAARECEREVQDRDGRWYSLRVRPYVTIDNKVDGAVLVLVDIHAAKEAEHEAVHARDFAKAIIATVREPFLVLDAALCVQAANKAFSDVFKISPAALLTRPLFGLNRRQWNIPALRARLENILPRHSSFNNFEVTHDFGKIGRRTLLLNARTLRQGPGHREKILLGIQDVTERRHDQASMRRSEIRYRRLFEAARDGIIILDPDTRKIADANPYIIKALGYTRTELFKKELWQIGFPRDATASRKAFLSVKKHGYIRYENLPLRSKDGRHHEVEFVSNLYSEDGHEVIQCNIRDITERKRVAQALLDARAQLAVHAAKLESVVTSRTAELTATNKQLKMSLADLGKGKAEYHALFLESEAMQEKLRHLTRQIISAQEEERKEISRELHDEVVQTLVGINVELAALGTNATAVSPALKAKISLTQRLVEHAVNAVHQFARELRPAVLDDLGLIPALHAYSKSLAARKKLKIQLTVFGGVEALGGAERTVLFRVAQEALTNVGRHAHATLVKLGISKIPGAIRMEITDNGKSFQVKKMLLAKNNKRLGLVGMKERIEMVGGHLTIESTPGKGTTVRAELPFNPDKTKK